MARRLAAALFTVACALGACAATMLRSRRQSASNDAELERECVEYLMNHMPARDTGSMGHHKLQQHARLALTARHAHSWAKAVPWPLFLNDVLPYRALDEPLDSELDWRELFTRTFAPIVADAISLSDAAQALNRAIWAVWGIKFVPDQTPEIMSPGQVLAARHASCTGLSIFLVLACRAVGIPARVAGTPDWVKDRRAGPHERFNNHCWVEVWDGSAWSFTGACEYDAAGLNRSWFFPDPAKQQRPGDRWHAIYAASYAGTGITFPLAWAPDDDSVPGLDVTQAYIDAAVPASAGGGAAARAADGAVAATAAGGSVTQPVQES